MLLDAIPWTIFGLILGSFANVLILREDTGESIGGRSHCPHCGRTLTWYELFPVLSFLLLRGRCRTCRKGIAWQYPLVEVLMATGAVLIGFAPVSLIAKVIGLPIFFILLCIAVYDLRTTYIPDRWAYFFALLAFISGVVALPSFEYADLILFLISGPLVAAPLGGLWLVSRGMWMGLGDGKVALGFGWLLGILNGYLALALAFVIGAVIGLTLIGITRFFTGKGGFTMKSEVPFGPFLILSLCIVWFSEMYDYDILAFLVRFLSLS